MLACDPGLFNAETAALIKIKMNSFGITFSRVAAIVAALMFVHVADQAFAAESAPGSTDVTRPVQLLPSPNLNAFYVFIRGRGVNHDVKKVFTPTNGMVRVSGEEEGYLATKESYSQYRLVTEYKWGMLPPGKTERDSGVFVHGHGLDRYFMSAVECSLYSGSNFVSGLVGPSRPNANPNWEKPIGEWNTLELFVDGSSVQSKLNGHPVKAISNAMPKSGKILL